MRGYITGVSVDEDALAGGLSAPALAPAAASAAAGLLVCGDGADEHAQLGTLAETPGK